MSTGAEHGLIWARPEEPPAALVDVRRPGDVRAEARSESPQHQALLRRRLEELHQLVVERH